MANAFRLLAGSVWLYADALRPLARPFRFKAACVRRMAIALWLFAVVVWPKAGAVCFHAGTFRPMAEPVRFVAGAVRFIARGFRSIADTFRFIARTVCLFQGVYLQVYAYLQPTRFAAPVDAGTSAVGSRCKGSNFVSPYFIGGFRQALRSGAQADTRTVLKR